MRTRSIGQATLALALAFAASSAWAQNTTQATLLDRIQIEELIVDYYASLGGGDAAAFGRFYTDDAELDVNGVIGRGAVGIEKLYRDLAGSNGPSRGTFHMLLSNPVIRVTGDTATATFLWTGVLNEQIKAPPRLTEQGREYDVLVKQSGKWRIRKRVIIADSGMPDMFDKTYTPRRNYDPLKD